MYRFSRLRFGFPLGLLLMLLLDGTISQVFSQQLFHFPYTMVSHLVVLWLVAGVLFEQQVRIPATVWAVIAGGLFDLYYTGIFGVYIFIFPLVVYLSRLMVSYIDPNFLSGLLIFFIDITVVESLGFLASRVIHLTTMAASAFMVDTLGPTLAFNLALFVVLYFPLRWIFNWLQ